MTNRNRREPELHLDPDGNGELCATGDWTLVNAEHLNRIIESWEPSVAALDASGISRLDASGALLLDRLVRRRALKSDQLRLQPKWREMFETIHRNCDDQHQSAEPGEPQWKQVLERIGRSTAEVAISTGQLAGFLGITVHRLIRLLRHPSRLKLTATVYHMEQTGLNAAPLLILLSTLVGAVVAFLGATVLRDFGAELFVIDLITFAFVREFGVLLTAILLAGRTASAFCAQIGMMKAREEIDAIRTLGLDEIELLVLPRLVALLIMLPLLAFIATLAGLFGGFSVAALSLDINATLFIDRVEQTLTLKHYLVGMIKAPLFAAVIALIGCLEGMRVTGSAQSVGERTTIAVVRSLTMVIVIDAIAAIYFTEIGW
ncbi:MAG: ABC transporter permease [Thiogranum sp.]|nr:ABC transporter permease [Thiogranum sp.]